MNTFNGLPTHVLLVHAVVVLVPAASLAVAVSAWWPEWRRRLGVLTPLLALAALVLTPITTNAGEWLQKQLPDSPAIRKHAERGDQLWPFVLALFLLALAGYLMARRADRGVEASPTWLPLLVAVLATIAAVGATVQVARIGDSGARAVWEGTGST
jgi:hypothetical protein